MTRRPPSQRSTTVESPSSRVQEGIEETPQPDQSQVFDKVLLIRVPETIGRSPFLDIGPDDSPSADVFLGLRGHLRESFLDLLKAVVNTLSKKLDADRDQQQRGAEQPEPGSGPCEAGS